MSESYALTDISENIATITINRPDKLNALSDAVLEAVCDAVEAAHASDDVRVIVLHGADGNFAAGADIARFQKFDRVSQLDDPRPKQFARLAACPTPIVAAVEGYCLGAGTEVALLCDIVIAGAGAEFGLPEVTLGIMPGAGGSQRLPRSVGKSDAMLMVLTGDRFAAERAKDMGFVSEVVATGEARQRAGEIAARIAKRPPLSVRYAKQAVLHSYETPLQAGLSWERALFQATFATDDKEEGVAAFLEKRKPKFTGR